MALAVAGTQPLAAQAPGDSVRLLLREGPTVTGLLVSRSAAEWRLARAATDDLVVPDADVLRRERQVLRDRAKLRSQSMWIGMLVGTAAMIAVYQVEIGSQSNDPGLAGLLVFPLAAAGAAGGAVVGYAVGSSRPERAWREIP